MLYESHRHERLTDTAWDPDRAATCIDEIVRDTVDAYDRSRGLWPPHPRDNGTEPSLTLYDGAAGVLTALEWLRNRGIDIEGIDLDRAWHRAWETFQTATFHDSSAPSLLCGSAGLLLPMYGALGREAAADDLLEAVEANADHEAREFMWGSPGTMVAALQMHDWTGEDRWREAYVASARTLWEQWWHNERAGCFLWTQQFPRRRVRWVGACHGQFGNLDALLRGRELLPSPRDQVLVERAEDALSALAVEEGPLVNWPAVAAEREPRMVQWCHGATGAVTAFASLPTGERETVDAYLRRAGELIWQAGPLRKGPNLCHGTAGNGFALMKLADRTGEDEWMERARAFAMHGIEQYERIRREWDRGWYSLYTGDLGLAVFLQACLDQDPTIPGLDAWPRR